MTRCVGGGGGGRGMKIGSAIDTRRCLASQTFEEAFGRIQAGGGGGGEATLQLL